MAELILALDLADGVAAERLLDRIPDARWVKVGSVLMTREGPGLIGRLIARGLRVFLDLKWHDIPNTVAGAVTAACEQGVSLATVHTLGGRAMLEAAAEAAGPDLALVGVTVLTSLGPGDYAAALGREATDLGFEAERLARAGLAAGLRGAVCSSWEAARLRTALGPAAWLVVPGIRAPGDPAGDQVRTATPAEAVAVGATHLVVGRPVLRAADPRAAWARLVAALVAPV